MVVGSFEYLKKLELYAIEKPYEILVPMSLFPNSNIPRTNLAFEAVTVDIDDVRGKEEFYNLDRHGFAFAHHPVQAMNLKDRETIEQTYISEVQSLLRREIPGIKRLLSFDWRVSPFSKINDYKKLSYESGPAKHHSRRVFETHS
jgi:hypothetical protein